MKILLATPLYPPDIAPPAPYVKELAKRLSMSHQVTILTYGKLPEQVPGVQIVAVSKGQMLPLRLLAYTFKLFKAARHAEVIYAQNGASVELPLFLISLFTSTPIILGFGDKAAHTRTNIHPVLRYLERLIRARAKALLNDLPPPRPIIMPLEPYPQEHMDQYGAAWDAHLQKLSQIFSNYE